MLTIYIKTGCAFCAKVICALEVNSVAYEEKNVADPAVTEELIALGGKKQMPYMVDGDVRMYESDDIVAYIEKTYGENIQEQKVKPKIHIAGGSSGVCPS
jgi:glutaredoxin 2